MIDREKIDYEARQDKMAEYREQCHIVRQDYCEKHCCEHNEDCMYYDPEEEVWDYEECFRDKGW